MLLTRAFPFSINYLDRGNLPIAAPGSRMISNFRDTSSGFCCGLFFGNYEILPAGIHGWLVQRLDALNG